MLLRRSVLEGIAAGKITLAFRRWKRPAVRAGGRLRTAIGELAIEAVDEVTPRAITAAAARRAGHASRAALLAELDRRPGARLYRIRLRLAGPDPRVARRARPVAGSDERAKLERRLARLDAASRTGPWTTAVLRAIARHPGRRAADLASALGQDTARFKPRVRRLKELGLTESLETGYRLSPRGRSLLRRRRP